MSENMVLNDMPNAEALMDMFAPAELHPDLKRYRTKAGPFEVVKHPLVFSVPHHDAQNKITNKRYEQVLKRLAQAEKENDYHTCIWLHERPHRIDAFVKYFHKLAPKEYWSLLGSLWTDTENAWQAINVWQMLWERDTPERLWCMDEDEQKKYSELPNRITAWRGCMSENIHGLSWTLDRKKADFFAKRYSTANPRIYEAKIPKSSVFAYFDGRNESEIVVKPKTFRIKKIA